MLRKTLSVAVFVLLLAAPVLAQVGPQGGKFCARVQVGSESVDPMLGGRTYSVQKTQDIHLLVLFLTEVKGDHILEVKLKTPRGHLYQTLTAPISTSQTEAGATRPVPTYPRPLEVQVLEPYSTRQGTRLGTVLTFPVAGTSIVTSSLYGEWEAEVYLDGEGMTCAVRNPFVIAE